LGRPISKFSRITSSKKIEYPGKEELYFVRDGNGTLHFSEESHPLAPNDFAYLPPAVRHSISSPSNQPLQIVVTGPLLDH
jgi:mannose-6-phosphate isomerase-like protein (cupin superfamily)